MTIADEALVAERLASVRERIARAAARAGREPGSVTLVAVSKTHPAAAVRAAYAAGQRDFGESYVQELVAKAEALRDLDGLRWHLIGRLQRNKVRAVVPIAHRVHAVDRAELAAELERRAVEAGRVIGVLVEVNVGGEASKAGCRPEDLDAVVAAVRAAPHLALHGLMTIPPATPDAEGARPYFAALRGLARERGLAELSMGMTHDFEVAIEEGATIVRVGTAIFGERASKLDERALAR